MKERHKFMESNLETVEFLSVEWWNLTDTVLIDKTFDEEVFLSLFKKTFAAVCEYSCKNFIHREVMELVKNISGFLGTRFTPINNNHSAACEFTDAMLTHCFCGEKKYTLTSKGTWSLFGDEIEVDFDNSDDEFFEFVIRIDKLDDMGIW